MTQPLKILQVSTADVFGGAEKVAYDLHTQYLKNGHDSTLAVGFKFRMDPHVVLIDNDKYRSGWSRFWSRRAPVIPKPPQQLTASQKARRQILKAFGNPTRALKRLCGLNDFDYPGSHELLETAHEYDVVHLHNMHGGYFDLRILPELCKRTTVCCTAHDMWLATGHCAYGVDCSRWKTGCGKCPHLDFPPAVQRDATNYNWLQKKDIFAKCGLHVIGPAQWVISVLSTSILKPAIRSTRVIANGVDPLVFYPRNHMNMRKDLGIDEAAFVIAFTQAGPNPYKDAQTIESALPLIRAEFKRVGINRTPAFLHIGAPENVSRADGVIRVPYTTNANQIAEALSAADVYIHSAKAEVLPLSILEAQACGIPVIVGDVGGASEALIDTVTGIVVAPQSPEALATACTSFAQDPQGAKAMGDAALEFSQQRTIASMSDQYLSFYQQIIASK